MKHIQNLTTAAAKGARNGLKLGLLSQFGLQVAVDLPLLNKGPIVTSTVLLTFLSTCLVIDNLNTLSSLFSRESSTEEVGVGEDTGLKVTQVQFFSSAR